jgi:hypothetical protein
MVFCGISILETYCASTAASESISQGTKSQIQGKHYYSHIYS